MNYPNGRKNGDLYKQKKLYSHQFGNRGMSLEKDINDTNAYYLEAKKAVIHKKPTPVQIVKVNYPKRSAAVITEAYFKQASTTDYNGVYREKYIDFEAKETKNKTLFPLANIHDHQVDHMQAVVAQGGITFLLIRFSVLDETYLFPAERLFTHWDAHLKGDKKSIAYKTIKQQGYFIPFQYKARVDYLTIIDKLYF
ncbi:MULTISPECIES: Holliday junction resolvase RecU [Virgibacillus]|uniref:Holliday junction resolvase RecU n=1 Tax=Virgibacillus chiguensis TaxID=411959 RepID=A0A1M5LDW2_9BACI|nr:MULTISPECIES: Holliday junction resolvase RecU [Virgibacillus]SHG63140.1 recombination protein U [Virgibacillus chiguensis]